MSSPDLNLDSGSTEFLDRLQKLVWRRVLANRFRQDTVEDLEERASDIMFKVYRMRVTGEDIGNLKAYIDTVVRNEAVGKHRHDSAQRRGGGRAMVSIEDVEPVADDDGPAELCDRALQIAKVKEAMYILPRAHREVLTCFFKHDKSWKAIGQELKRASATVQSQYWRSIALLQAEFGLA